MREMFLSSAYFGITLSLLAYLLGMWLKRKLRFGWINPLLIAVLVNILVLICFRIDYADYNRSAQFLSYLLSPATVCLAIPLYEQLGQLRKHWKAVLAGIFSGVLSSLGSILGMSVLFKLSHEQYVTLLPKSVTTAIGIAVSEELGGITSITAAVIIITGVLGNMIGGYVCRLFRIREPVAKGVALGTASHAIGTAKAMEMGQLEGAISSLSIAVSGILTVALASFFAAAW